MELLGDLGHVASCFGPFGDIVSVVARKVMVCVNRTKGLEIILAAPDGILRRRGSSGCSFHSVWRYC
jgi:hypothetical protein